MTTSRNAGFGTSVDDQWAWVECRLDAGPWFECDSARPQYDVALADGVHHFEARARDAVGNVQDPPASWTWRVDTKRPETTFQSGPQGATLDTNPTFTFSAGESVTFICSLDGASPTPCSSPYHVSDASIGTHTFWVQATDEAGNTDLEVVERRWNVGGDVIAPETSFIDTPPVTTSAPSSRFKYESNEFGSFECRLDDEPWHTCLGVRELWGLAEGMHTFSARAIDEGGNVDPTPETWRWRVDTTPSPPAFTAVSTPDDRSP